MLRVLIFVLIGLIANLNISLADTRAYEQHWLNSMKNDSQAIGLEHFKELMSLPGFDLDLRAEVLKPRPVLQIFVSSSMPEELLKAYAREANRYGGVLVFCGLPEESVRKLADLVIAITDKQYPAAMQIDDESFSTYKVTNVPTIVLSKPPAMFADSINSRVFDKISGTITLKSALELFAESGDMSIEARRLLQ